MTYSVAGVPTASREPMRRLTSLGARYLRDDPADRVGRAVALRGEHGVGKTHALLFALAELTSPEAAEADPARSKPPLALYVRADGPDPVMLYGKLMSQFGPGDLRELAREAFAGYAAEAFSDTRAAARADAERVLDELRSSPELALAAVEGKQLSLTAVINRQEAALEGIQKRLGWFDRAVRGLLEPALADLAHRWFSGDELDDRQLASLGVPANIRSPDDTRVAVHVLAALARAARRPLVLVLDQAESLLVGSDGALD